MDSGGVESGEWRGRERCTTGLRTTPSDLYYSAWYSQSLSYTHVHFLLASLTQVIYTTAAKTQAGV